MTQPVPIQFRENDAESLADQPGRIAVLADPGASLSPLARKLDKLTRGAVARAVAP